MREWFRDVNFTKGSKDIIEKAVSILDQYAEQGYDLSLRQLYYQFVSRNWLENNEQNYKRLGDIISNARDAGLVDWGMIRDRGRSVERPNAWDSPSQIIEASANQYKRDLWEDQPSWAMCMVEKQALEGVLAPVCDRLRIPFSANKGYASSSHLYDIGKMIQEQVDNDKEVHVIYLGDHDPSGIDMTRDVEDRLGLYSSVSECITVHRVALNMPQVRQYQPPPNPAKLTDSRANSYISNYGDESWELDALNPATLSNLVERQVLSVRDGRLWEVALQREIEEREGLLQMAREYRLP